MRQLLGRRERGQALVEFGIVVVVLMLLVLGTVEVGRAVWNYNTLSNAVREGTRYAIVHGENSSTPVGPGANDTAVESKVEQFASGIDTDQLTVTSTWLDGSNAKGSRVEVSASYTFDTIFADFLGVGSFTLDASSTMTITN